jgi:hypothetical protein
VSDFTAVFLPGAQWTSTAAGTIVGGDPLEVAGSGTVQKASAASTKFIGVAGSDAASGAKVTIISSKVVFDGVAEGSITAGDQLVTSAVTAKTVKTFAAASVTAIDVGVTPTQTSINTAVNAAITAINTALGGPRTVVGIALTTASDGATVRWIQK